MTDTDILKNLSLSQSEVARILKTSRQAVNAGIKKSGLKDNWIDANRLYQIYDFFIESNDRREVIAAKLLKDNHGIEARPRLSPYHQLENSYDCINHERAVEVLRSIIEKAPNGVLPENFNFQELGRALELLLRDKYKETDPLMQIIMGWLAVRFRNQYNQVIKEKMNFFLEDLS